MSEKAFFKVVGMYCTSCKPIVEKQLKDEEGVKKILSKIDYWKEAPLWEPESIALATKTWFNFLSK